VSVYQGGVKIAFSTTMMSLMLLCGIGATSQHFYYSSNDMFVLFPLSLKNGNGGDGGQWPKKKKKIHNSNERVTDFWRKTDNI
jgi:hypothetical protein